MRIGIIGSGWLGGTVGRIWAQAGHDVMFSSRDPSKLTSLVAKAGPTASAGTHRQAADFGTALLFAVTYDALPELGVDLADSLRGKIVLDACNPSSSSDNALAREGGLSSVGEMSARYLPGARLVRAFSAVDATAVDASFAHHGQTLGVPLASDDAEALRIAAQLVVDAGCEPVITGNLATGASFQRGGAGFRANTDAPTLRRRLKLPATA
ncbi:NADPH-dependent F420 reductase [Bosea sp. (in: a-proteobacteria)]|uniref:NADPH-dependent F420 reductase n=1 Tax=Bosea sp. (in: a-proteobacteria) TaxID=1871050 RepID=UPI002B46D134|nr:NAD(P)-binding domain-containing protein [Bosea sp. (in: a-proteobacteria)]WRH57914.1 MAG: NAD(P)-binding domain-containing protein [Bosea sp. (in: a-proteobacteria)]